MKKYTILVCIILLSFLSFGQAAGNSYAAQVQTDMGHAPISLTQIESYPMARVANMEHLTIKVNGLYNAKADGFLAIFNLVQTGKTTSETDSLYQSRFEAFRYELFKMGIEEKDVYVDFISFLPIYEVEVTKKMFSKKYEEVPKGFEMQKNIHILMDNPKQLDPIISAAAAQGIYDLVKVEYFVRNQDDIVDELRSQVQKLLKTKENEFKTLDIAIENKWRMVGDTWNVHYPLQRYKSYTAKTRYTVDDVSNKKDETVKEVRVPQTHYYSKVDYNQFDVVVQPEFVDPVIQFTYSIVMEYEVTRPKPPKEPTPPAPVTKEIKKFILILPNGQTKELDA